jgi:hypothetical protein
VRVSGAPELDDEPVAVTMAPLELEDEALVDDPLVAGEPLDETALEPKLDEALPVADDEPTVEPPLVPDEPPVEADALAPEVTAADDALPDDTPALVPVENEPVEADADGGPTYLCVGLKITSHPAEASPDTTTARTRALTVRMVGQRLPEFKPASAEHPLGDPGGLGAR